MYLLKLKRLMVNEAFLTYSITLQDTLRYRRITIESHLLVSPRLLNANLSNAFALTARTPEG
jgi:hypothetical protein